MGKKVYVRRPHNYGGEELDRGQVIELQNQRNDEKLLRLGYLMELPKNSGMNECGKCGAKFIDAGARDAHGRERHEPERPLSPDEQDAFEIRKEQQLNEVAPLFLDKTKASLGLV